MVDTQNKVGSHGRGSSRGAQERSHISIRQGGCEGSPEQPSDIRTTTVEEATKAL